MATSRWRSSLALKPPALPVADALRLVGPTVLIVTGSALAGHYLLGLLIALGTYTVLFGGIPDRRHRFAVMVAAGTGLIVAICIGMLSADSLTWTLIVYLTIILAAAILDEALPLGPPGPAFFVLMVGAGQTIGATPTPIAFVVPPIALGAGIAVVAAMAGSGTAADTEPDAKPPLLKRLQLRFRWPSSHAVTIIRIASAVVVLTILSQLLNDRHPFWSVLVALLVLSYPGDDGVLVHRALNRLGGTAVGIIVYWLWTLLDVPQSWNFVAVGLLLWAASRLAPRNYAYASIAITALALLMTEPLVADVEPFRLALNRLADTGLAAVVSLLLLLIRPRRIATTAEGH